MRETWEKKVMKFEREIPIGLDARRKKRQGGGAEKAPPPNGIRVKTFKLSPIALALHKICVWMQIRKINAIRKLSFNQAELHIQDLRLIFLRSLDSWLVFNANFMQRHAPTRVVTNMKTVYNNT